MARGPHSPRAVSAETIRSPTFIAEAMGTGMARVRHPSTSWCRWWDAPSPLQHPYLLECGVLVCFPVQRARQLFAHCAFGCSWRRWWKPNRRRPHGAPLFLAPVWSDSGTKNRGLHPILGQNQAREGRARQGPKSRTVSGLRARTLRTSTTC